MHPSRTGVELQLRTVRTANAKLTVDQITGAGELYVLSEDPDEMVNRFGDSSVAGIQNELTDMIAARPGAVMDELPGHGQDQANPSV